MMAACMNPQHLHRQQQRPVPRRAPSSAPLLSSSRRRGDRSTAAGGGLAAGCGVAPPLLPLLLLLAALLATTALPSASARPVYFRTYLASAPCTQHPSRELKSLGAPHGTPRQDKSITFILRNSSGAPVTTGCPGAQHTLTVSFPQRRLALLTASQGVFAALPSSEALVDGPRCPNRVDLGRSFNPNTTFAVAFTAPCNATGEVQFRVTSATLWGAGNAPRWCQADLEVEVEPGCAAASCDDN